MPEPENAGRGGIGMIPWTYLALFDLFLLSLLILSARLATFFHEVLGHGLIAAALGGTVNGIRISLFGGGNAYYRFHAELGPAVLFAVAFGGILINLLTGAFAIGLANRPRIHGGRNVFLAVFGMVSLWGGLAYSCLGFYYGVGDPAASLRDPSQAGSWLWLPFLGGAPLAAYLGVRSFLRSVRSWFPAHGFPGKILVLALTLGITVAIYALLYLATEQRSVAVETPKIAQLRAEEEIRDERKAEEGNRLRENHPEWTEEDLARARERIIIEIRPEEVPRKPPLIPVLVFAYLVGSLLALRPDGGFSIPHARISAPVIVSTVALAAATLLLLAATGGWLWRTGL